MTDIRPHKLISKDSLGICCLALLFALFLPIARMSHAQSASVSSGTVHPSGAWRSVGPQPPAIEASIALDAATHTVYIASLGGGILKSTDGGQTFTAANQGLDSLVVASLAMAHNNPNLVYAGTDAGIYKTINGGANWIITGSGGFTAFVDHRSN